MAGTKESKEGVIVDNSCPVKRFKVWLLSSSPSENQQNTYWLYLWYTRNLNQLFTETKPNLIEANARLKIESGSQQKRNMVTMETKSLHVLAFSIFTNST